MTQTISSRSPVLVIVAHPDDESFGIGGTIATLSQTRDVHLICVTDGNSYNTDKDLTTTRRNELEAAGKILGIKEIICFGYPDGSLNNAVYHEVAAKIEAVIDRLKPGLLITFETNGVSGHLDHIACAFITTYVFRRRPEPQELWYFCGMKRQTDRIDDYFIYHPPGRTKAEVDFAMDISDVWEKKIAAIKTHRSQKEDGKWIINSLKPLPKAEYFMVLKK